MLPSVTLVYLRDQSTEEDHIENIWWLIMEWIKYESEPDFKYGSR
jgi:hypothetical protein